MQRSLYRRLHSVSAKCSSCVRLFNLDNIRSLSLFTDCIFEGKKCDLIINIDNGFTVQDCATTDVVLKKDFSELVNSSDDNARFVTLQFKNEKVSRVSLGNFANLTI